MKQITYNKSRGLTLTELLAVLMIISLLATIAVPVYVNRQEDARESVAIGECQEIAKAEKMVGAMLGFYVPFQLLDDLPADREDDDLDLERIDRNPFADNISLINATIRAEEQFVNDTQPELNDGYVDSPSNNDGELNVRARNLVANWSGPYLTYQRFWYNIYDSAPYEGPTDPIYHNDEDLFRDFPLDPWGNPYRFYSPIGIIGGVNEGNLYEFEFEDPDTEFSNGELTRTDEDRFQRYAVVSYGRDGFSDTDINNVPDPENTLDNDIYYEFGTDGLSENFGQF